MAVENQVDLDRAVAQASDLLQEIQNYCARNLRDDSKVKFPRGLIGTADSYRARCPEYLSSDKISSCSYGYMYLDVLWWISSRTDLIGIPKQMLIKSAIVTLGTLTEAVLWIPGLPRDDRLSHRCGTGVKPRLDETQHRG